jgi:tyrosine-protein kinase Etk/Wzc
MAELGWLLVSGRWIVAGFVALAVFVAAAYLLTATRTYRTEALIEVERPPEVAGIEPVPAYPRYDDSGPGDSDLELLRSRSLVESVVDRLGLDVDVRARAVPLVGRAAMRLHWTRPGVVRAPFGLTRFAWGGERIRIEHLALPEGLAKQPMILTALGDGRYRLASGGGAVLEGRTGTPASADAKGRVEIHVAELVARPGTEFIVRKLPRSAVVQRLQRALQVEERGRKTGIIAVALEDDDPRRVASIADALVATYLKQRVERKSLEAHRTVAFLEGQIPSVRTAVEKAEAALNAFQLKYGTVDLPVETRVSIERTAEMERTLAGLEVDRTELLKRHTDQHPGVADLTRRIEALRAARDEVDTRFRALPVTTLRATRLTRDVRVSTELYVLLLDRLQRERIMAARVPVDARMVDAAAVPDRPVSPKKSVVFTLSVLVGLGTGIAAVVVRRRFQGADDPVEVESATGVPVLAMVAHRRRKGWIWRRLARRATDTEPFPALDPYDGAVEDLRSLRTSVQGALRESRNNVVAIGGASPGVGKSFVCLNLARLVAGAGRRVLVIDADLRRGGLHRELHVEREPGLADVLSGEATLEGALRKTGIPGLDLLPAGRPPADPPALLEGAAFETAITEAAKRYDVVIVDTPAILAVADGAAVARHAGVNLLVLRAGQHPLREIALALERLARAGGHVSGAVLNDLRSRHRYGRYGRYRRYSHRTGAE